MEGIPICNGIKVLNLHRELLENLGAVTRMLAGIQNNVLTC